MDLASIFLTLAVAMLVGMFITRPFASRRAATERLIRPATEAAEMQRSTLLAERDRVLNSLQELEFDFTLGKIPAEDYPIQRAELLKAGADVLRELDELTGTQQKLSAEARVEAVVAARRADAVERNAEKLPAVALAGAPLGIEAADLPVSRRPPSPANDELEAEIAARRQVRQEKAGGFCPKCGRPVVRSDRFCSKCGTAL
jgi:hypothetical protein